MPKVKILLDECIDRRLAKDISHHSVKTVPQMGWAGLTNGMLLSRAHKEFDVFLTNDQNLSAQQNLSKYDISILVLCPRSNRIDDLRIILKKALKEIGVLKAGQVVFIK